MDLFKRISARSWPIAAVALVSVFIIYGLVLISRSRQLQQKITQEVQLLDDLNRLSGSLNQLSLTHRMDVGTRQYRWPDELASLRTEVERIGSRFHSIPCIAELPRTMKVLLHQADSLHANAMTFEGTVVEQRPNEVVFQFMLQRAQGAIERSTRHVHEQGLSAHTATLSAGWDEAQFLLIAACLLAVVFAWLVGVSNKLLLQSRLRSEQLDIARQNLEHANQELRETMLSKEEKEVMLKEIHHRVKNNLQIVKSLIRFQMDQVQDPKTTELFNECVNRVSAMALVHEQTYLSKDLANIDVSSYLSHLTRDLCYAYTIDIKLDMDIRINVPTMSVDTLIPLGLIINEVISNSLKYAFKGRRKGTIIVHIDGDEHSLHMRLGDDGVGLPDRSKWERPNSLGMDLIHTLAGQLNTSVELMPGAGTVYELMTIQQERRKRA
ncbi:MAG: sensor histidine kinase [Flavobacteriales bacterium]|nr:sensor histidine kinase [Flavobacteriales bacterium]